MRFAIGLAAILVAIGVVVWIMHAVELPAAQQALDTRKKIEPQVQQMAGVDSDGGDSRKGIGLDAETSGGKMTSVDVTRIDPQGRFAQYFGLQKGDSIVEIATQGGVMTPVKEIPDPSTAKDDLLTSMQNFQQIVVVRNGQKMTLPAAPAAKPAAPAATPSGSANSLQDQLNQIQKVPSH